MNTLDMVFMQRFAYTSGKITSLENQSNGTAHRYEKQKISLERAALKRQTEQLKKTQML